MRPEIAATLPTRSKKRLERGERTLTAQAIYDRLRRTEVDLVPRSQRISERVRAAVGNHERVATATELAELWGVTPAAIAYYARSDLPQLPRVLVFGKSMRVFSVDAAKQWRRRFAHGLIVRPQFGPRLMLFHADGRRASWQEADKVLARLKLAGVVTTIEQADLAAERLTTKVRALGTARRGAPIDVRHFEWLAKRIEIHNHEQARFFVDEREEPPGDWEVCLEVAREDTQRWPLGDRVPGWERGAAKTVLQATNRLQIALPSSTP